jgi:hypothetical protein
MLATLGFQQRAVQRACYPKPQAAAEFKRGLRQRPAVHFSKPQFHICMMGKKSNPE